MSLGDIRRVSEHGPFFAHQIRPGDPYELSSGHPVTRAPTGGRGSRSNVAGAIVLDTDPAVESSGIDTGFSPDPKVLRAPDVAVGNVPDAPGWVRGVPPLAVEYADTGQDEDDLEKKVGELLAAGTKWIWVVRLTGPRRVEVRELGKAVRIALPGEELAAPGVLRHAVPVEALYDRREAHRLALRNLLEREGYDGLEAVKQEGHGEGKLEGARSALRRVLARRGLAVSREEEARIDACADPATLERWLDEAVVAASAGEALR